MGRVGHWEAGPGLGWPWPWAGLEGCAAAAAPPPAHHTTHYSPPHTRHPPRTTPQGQDLAQVVPDLDAHGLDLLRQMLVYHPQQRITARQARNHPWFEEFRQPHMMYYQ